jgi:hypothetical protein
MTYRRKRPVTNGLFVHNYWYDGQDPKTEKIMCMKCEKIEGHRFMHVEERIIQILCDDCYEKMFFERK